MNNKYDREDAPKTYDEMVAAGYEMTGEGFWVPQEEHPEVLEPIVRLFLLRSGEQVLSRYSENSFGTSFTLSNPILVREELIADGTQSNVAYEHWLPLSADRNITVRTDYVVSITTPLEELVKTYEEITDGN